MSEKSASITYAQKEERARVMIIDDDQQLGEVLAEIISSWGPMVECHTKPLLALKELKKVFYHVVLLDVSMPEISGLDMLPEISKLWKDTKIIIMSGTPDKEIAIKALRAGAFDFLQKPFEMALLSHSIRRALDIQKVEIENRMTHEALEQSRKKLLLNEERLENVDQQPWKPILHYRRWLITLKGKGRRIRKRYSSKPVP